jgi:hypothetical protein
MIIGLFGLFFTNPNALIVIFTIIGHVFIKIQLKEDFFKDQNGQKCLDFNQNVRRLI